MGRELQLITNTQQDIFLTAYRKTGLMQQSAKLAGLTKHDIEQYCKRNTAEAESFLLNLQDASDSWSDTIRKEITRRAITGVEKAIYYKGMFVDTLLVKMAESTLPEYKKAVEKETGGITIQINTFTDGATPVATIIEDITPTYVSDLE
jgi:uncharacterized protein with ParB-like and HNH nuclease domain